MAGWRGADTPKAGLSAVGGCCGPLGPRPPAYKGATGGRAAGKGHPRGGETRFSGLSILFRKFPSKKTPLPPKREEG
jgi:hypothetical protein